MAARRRMARCASLRRRATLRRDRRRRDRERHVRPAAILRIASRSRRWRAMVERVRRDLRSARRHLGLRPSPFRSDHVCRRGLHRGRLLVHVVDVVRNRAVSIARSLSDTFSGIRPIDVRPFILAQLAGAAAATALFRWLSPTSPSTAEAVLLPHVVDRKEPEYAVR